MLGVGEGEWECYIHLIGGVLIIIHLPPPLFLMMIRATSTITVTPFQKKYSFAGACVDTKLRGASKELVV